jgi:hypothetical protein
VSKSRKKPDSKLVESKRADARGHWPAGVPRHPVPPHILRRLRAARSHMTLSQIGAVLGCDKRTVHRWLIGLQNPSEAYQAAIMEKLK